jgi:hypothetical protein
VSGTSYTVKADLTGTGTPVATTPDDYAALTLSAASIAAGWSYVAATGVLTASGTSTGSAVFTSAVAIDALVEPTEGIKVTLSTPTGTAAIDSAKTIASTSITDAPAPTFTISSNGSTMRTEGNTVTFSVTPSSAVLADTTMTYTINGDTLSGVATAAVGADFSKASGTISFVKGQITASTVAIDLKTGDGAESLEGYKFIVLDSNLATVGTDVLGQIIDADTAAGGGTTYTLLSTTDIVPGTSGDDTINGSVDLTATNTVGATSTLSAADQITGGAGTADTLNIAYSGAFATNTGIPAASISGVEIINVRNVTGLGLTGIDIGLIPGVTSFVSDRSNGAVTVTNLSAVASAGMKGDSSITNGAFNAGWVTSATAPATAATLNISNGTTAGAVTLSGANLTSTTVNSTGATNTIGALAMAATSTTLTINATTNLTTGAVTNTTAAATTKVVLTGAGAIDLSVTALENTVATVDATANTGGVTVAVANLATAKFTGGTGNDVVTTAAVLTTGTADGGLGTDTLNIGTNVGHANTVALAAKYTSFETLRVNGTFDASLISTLTAVQLSGATNDISKMTATQAAAVTGLADIGATTLALALATGTSDVLTLTLGNGKGAAFDTGALTATGFETINIKANPLSTNADTTSVIASIVDANLTKLNLTGSSVTLTSAATTLAVAIDASALTGSGAATPVGLTITGGNTLTGSTITGSAVRDIVTALGTGFATYNLGWRQ